MYSTTLAFIALAFVYLLGTHAVAGTPVVPDGKAWGDLGDGTFANPILPSDYSDIDAIRVGDDFYAISSTFQYSPGMVILHSKDLVNWTIISHAIKDVTQIGPEMNWDKMSRYGEGVWAGAIRYHDDKFWIYFGTPNEGYFVTTSKDIKGPWEPLTHIHKFAGWDDCCPFWDDDGQGYLIGSQFSVDPKNGKKYNIHLFKLSKDGKSIDYTSDRIIHQSQGSEANKLYKIKGTYYHYFSEVRPEGRVVMMGRSKSLDGPWETRQLNHAVGKIDPNQGGLIEFKDGSWWFLTHNGSGNWAGRVMNLLPVTWIDGWPIMGEVGADGIGNMMWTGKKPINGFPVTLPQTSDEFDKAELGQQWEWNYQPRADKWSITERPGFLRLKAFKPIKKSDLLKAGNTLTQRCFKAANCKTVAKIDISKMANGQFAGFSHFGTSYCALGVKQTDGNRTIILNNNNKMTTGEQITSDIIYLQSTWGLDAICQFAYSTDGKTFTNIGDPYKLAWGHYRGDRLALFSYNDLEDAGHIDVDSFHFTFDQK